VSALANGGLSGVFVVFACTEAHNPVITALIKSILTHLLDIQQSLYESHVTQRARYASST
jgi:hypothetical protein